MHKFFAGKNQDTTGQPPADPQPQGQPKPPEPAPAPKKAEGSAPLFGGLAVKKKFEKPNIPPKPDAAENSEPTNESPPQDTDERVPVPTENPEDSNRQSVNDTSMVSQGAPAPKAGGGALSFIERMRLRKEQEEAAKLSSNQGSGQDLNSAEAGAKTELHNTSISDAPSKPRFGFIKTTPSMSDHSEPNNTSSTSGTGPADLDQSQTTEQPKRTPPFKFLQTKKQAPQPEEEGQSAQDQPEQPKATPVATGAPKFSFLRPKTQSSPQPPDDGDSPAQTPSKVLAGLHDENNPAEVTLNLSYDRDRTGLHTEEHLAETLDRVDQEDEEVLDEPTAHKSQSRKESAKEAKIKPEVFVTSL